MPKSVCLIFSSKISVETLILDITRLLGVRRVDYNGHYKSIQFIDDNNGAYVDFMVMSEQSEVREDYKTNDLLCESFREALDGKMFFMVSYDQCNLLLKVLKILYTALLSSECWIDDGDGNVLILEEFISKADQKILDSMA